MELKDVYIVKTNNLSKSYNKKTVINSCNMSVKKGRIYCLVGQNGAGKTTLFKILLGLTSATQGTATVLGMDCKNESLEILARTGSLIETPVFYEHISARKNLKIHLEYKITGLKTNLTYLKRIMHNPDFVKGEYNTLFIEKNSRMLQRPNSNNEEIENIAMIAAYIDYLMNLEENSSTQSSDGRPISRWREFGLQKGVLRS